MSVVLTCDFKTLLRVIEPVINQNKPLLLRGKHGIGKSELVYQMSERMYWDRKKEKTIFIPLEQSVPTGIVLNFQVIERRVSQMTEGDLVGLPVISGTRTSFNPPDWYKDACEQPVLLFFDEIDRGTIEVRQGLFEITDSRKLNGHKLHPGTVIVAAVNGGKYASQYQVGEMDPAELDRWSVFDLEPSIEDWLFWAKKEDKKQDKNSTKNIHQNIIDFINSNRNHLEHLGEYEPHKKYPSRRSWKRASDVLSDGKYLEKYVTDIVILSAAFIGMEAAIALGDYIKNHKKIVTPKDIIDDGKLELTSEFIINEHCSLIDKIEQMGVLKKTLNKQQLENFVRYFFTLPSECATKLFKILGESDNKENTINVYGIELDGKKVNLHMVKMLTSQEQ